jgi:methionyl-tRNA synthetase
MTTPFYITTAINYPNGRPHVGHAYEAIATDAIARFQRQMGRDVRFQTGTDEHGLKMAQTARDRGSTARARRGDVVYFREMGERLISPTIGSSQPPSPATTGQPGDLEGHGESGDIYLGRYEGWYSVRDEAYYDERSYVTAGKRRAPFARRGRMSNGRSRRAGSSAYPISGASPPPIMSEPELHPPGRAPQRVMPSPRALSDLLHLAHSASIGE